MTTQDFDRAAAAAELEIFKTANLIDLAVQMGWTVTEKGRTSAKVAKGSMSIAIFKGSSAWMWKCFTGEGPGGKTAGTVVDLALEASGGSMGKARQLLRSLTGTSAPTPGPTSTNPAPVSVSTRTDSSFSGKTYKSSEQVVTEYRTGAKIWQPGDPLPPFLSERGVTEVPEAFHGRFAVTTDRHRAARFLFAAYVDGKAVHAGVEDRNLARAPGEKSYRSYTENGRAGFWFAPGDPGAPVVVVEAPLEAMSFDIIWSENAPTEQVGYVAVRSGSEADVVRYLLGRIAAGTRSVVMATNNDAAGLAYASKIMAGLAEAKRAGEFTGDVLVRYLPPPDTHTDWNDALMARRPVASDGRSRGGPSPRPESRPAPRRPRPADASPCLA